MKSKLEFNVLVKNIEFPVRDGGSWKKLTTKEIFENKKIVIFSLPGAFTPTCSSTHLPRYEQLYDKFKSLGVDEVYCVSVNDTFVMNEWAKCQGIKNIKLIPDGNADFTKLMEMDVLKEDLGFGIRSWRYSALIDNGVVVEHFVEPQKPGDPFEVSDADTMLKAIDKNYQSPDDILLFTKKDCPFCTEAKQYLLEKSVKYEIIELSDANRNQVLRALVGAENATVPQMFVNGKLVGGTKEIKEKF